MASEPTGHNITPKRLPKMASAQSLNHLLNFTLPPRQTSSNALPRRSKKPTSQVVWNKERFVNAQYRFVMNPMGDYTVHFADPDIFFQWQDILQVIVPRASAYSSAASGGRDGQDEGLTTCPICLSPPVSPRMTKCGHVFCFPCILHYLSLSDNLKWARCPICFDSVNEKQLKSVKWYEGPALSEVPEAPAPGNSSSVSIDDLFETTPRTGSFMRMRLMQRPQITTLALPRSQTWPSDVIPPHQAPFHFLPDVYAFAKFMLATPEYLIADISKDLDTLSIERRSMAAVKDELSIVYINAAEDKLRHQLTKAAALQSPLLTRTIDKVRREYAELRQRLPHGPRGVTNDSSARLADAPDAFLAIQRSPSFASHQSSTPSSYANLSTQLESQKHATQPTNNRTHRQRRNLNPPPPSTQTYYYYQAASGLPVFLHPLDIKILFSHFNGYASFPDEITVRVGSAAEGTVNDELRKRCKYLAHMPEGADVVFIEADLEAVVGPEGLKNFEGALKLRTARKKEKERKDDRARSRAEEREKERMKLLSRAPENVAPVFAAHSPHVSEDEEPPAHVPAPQPTSGAWGSRSFASAVHSAPAVSRPQQANRGAIPEIGDEWDFAEAWHEAEQHGGGRKRGKKLVVLGSGTGGRRR